MRRVSMNGSIQSSKDTTAGPERDVFISKRGREVPLLQDQTNACLRHEGHHRDAGELVVKERRSVLSPKRSP